MTASQPAIFKRARQVVAERIWEIADRLYPYEDPETSPDVRYWTMDATFIGTEAEANGWFDMLTALACCGDKNPHDCRLAVGGMRWEPIEEGDGD